ncbi:MAG TPA: RNA polymerase sigma factor [Kofleriaceae bacterium]|jgi:RNA polymerase sigma-70 factor (ECF subfamily)
MQPPAALVDAREQFYALIADVRPELHRYCARLCGSVIQGEDLVQDVLAKAFYALTMQTEVPNLRAWLFRIAHNAALDFLKSHGHARTDARAEMDDVSDDAADPYAVRAALSRFLALTVTERSAVILKDVLGHSLDEAAETMSTTVPAVKAALVRGRAKLKEGEAASEPAPLDAAMRATLDAYARLFNARDWDGVRALIGENCSLDLVSKSQRRGKAVGMYFDRYSKENVRLEPTWFEGRWVLAAFVDGAAIPRYVILLESADGKVTAIRDFRYVSYMLAE